MPGASPPKLVIAEGNYKTPLKELYDHYSHCGNLEYRTRRLPNSSTQDHLQHACTLVCPAILHRVTEQTELHECSFEGMGRNKQEAEQSCARQALAHIRAAAPQLGVPEVPQPPHFPPASPYTLSTLFSSAEAASSHLAAGSSAAGSVDGHSHVHSTPGGTSSAASTAAAPGSPPQAADAAAAPSPAPAPSSRSAAASDADLDGMETDELRRALRQARAQIDELTAQNVELAARVARLEASADAERRCLQGVKQAIDEALRGLEL